MSAAGHPPLRVGLTGGIASGKTAVAELFAKRGVPVIDTDVIAREVVEPGQPALEDIRQCFGAGVIGSDGRLDRAAMRRRVFADAEERRRLEAILHPRIRDAAFEQAARAGGDYQVIVVPLLVESPMRERMDRILVVDLPESLQLERLLARDGGDRAGARAMIEAQASRARRLAIADDVIDNSGSRDATRAQVDRLHARYRARAASASA